MTLVAGTRLGHYEVVAPLGAGGMGEVYRATDTKLGRDVALKVLPAEMAARPERLDRFQREAMALAALDHPGIVTVYSVEEAEGVHFLTMQLIEGQSLDRLIPEGGLPPDRLLDIAAAFAEALAAAHGKGIVHRDLKPANVMVDKAGRLKVLDFGLARMTRPQAEEPGASALPTDLRTREGVVMGTVPYMSPEQALGREVDARADIFSLGSVLYEIATGQPPFCGSTQAAVLDGILHGQPVALPRVRPDLPAAFGHVVDKTLRKDPRERYQHTSQLAADLRHLQRESSGSAQAIRPAPRSLRRVLMVATPALIVALVSALWFTWQAPALSFAPRDWILVADFDNQTGETLFDHSLQAALLVGLEQSKHANVVPRTRLAAALKRMGKPDTQVIDEELGREICIREGIRGLVRCGIGRVGDSYSISARLIDPQTGQATRSYLERADTEASILDALGRVGKAVRRDLGESLGAIEQSNRPLPQVTTSSLEALKLFVDARELWRRREYKQAAAQMEAALQRDPDFAMAHAFLGSAYLSHIFARVDEGKRHVERALQLAARTTDRERAYIRAAYQHDLGRLAEAAESYGLYLRSWPDDLRVRGRFADLLRQTGDLDEAIRQYQELIRLAPSDAAAPYVNLATSYKQSGRIREAIDCYKKGFALDPEAITSGTLNHEYGFTLVAAGEPDQARGVFALAVKQPDTRARGLRSLGLLELYEGKHRAGAAALEEAALDNEAHKNALSAARDHLFLSIVRDAQGDRAGRLRELEKAASWLEGYTPPVWMVARVGTHFARAGAQKRASQLLTRARGLADLNDVSERAFVHFLEGEIDLATGRLDDAMRALRLAELETVANARSEVVGALARAARARKDPDADGRGEAFVNEGRMAVGWEPQQDWLAAHYDVASADMRRGDAAAARRRLATLLSLWKNADPDLPLLRVAKRLQAHLDAPAVR